MVGGVKMYKIRKRENPSVKFMFDLDFITFFFICLFTTRF